jgi:hypothetical protein
MSKVDKYRNDIARKYDVNPRYVEYIGMEDYDDLGIMYYYNITDTKSPEYKSKKVVR